MEKEYFRIHSWLAYYHGKAHKCENELCMASNPKTYEWALLKGKEHKRNRSNYIQLCISCHRKYDFTETIRANMSKAKKGKPAKNKKKIILNDSKIFESLTEGAKLTGVSITSINNNLKGLSKLTKVGKWKYMQTS